MLILHVLAPGAVGGLERVVRSLAAGHRALGHRVCVAVIHEAGQGDHPFVTALSELGIEVIPLRVAPRAYRTERAMIAELCGTLRPDVVHTHGYRADVVDAGVARSQRIPTVTTVHGFTGGGWKNRVYERLQRYAFRQFDAVVAVSRPLAEALVREGVPLGRVHEIRNAWDDAVTFLDHSAACSVLGVPSDGFRLGWVGRVSPEKGPDVMLQALALLGDTAVRLSMLGDGPERDRLQRRGEALGVAARMTWHGTVVEAASLFRAFDVFVLSSRTEGTPMALFEAMAAGVPIVATAVGGVPQVVSSAEAILVPPDDPTRLAAAIRETLRDPGAARDRARAARCRLEREFAVQPWLERYDMLYHTLAQRGAALAGR